VHQVFVGCLKIARHEYETLDFLRRPDHVQHVRFCKIGIQSVFYLTLRNYIKMGISMGEDSSFKLMQKIEAIILPQSPNLSKYFSFTAKNIFSGVNFSKFVAVK
jgi:hypothetical protein